MPELILIKHAAPLKDTTKTSSLWRLSDAGRERAAVLAERLRERRLDRVITSTEPKAQETGQVIADVSNIPIESADGLHEHDRSNVPVLPTREFISTVALFFKQPEKLVLGKETARQAGDRFEAALRSVLTSHPDERLAIVTHGTVLALFVARRDRDVDAFQLWRRMGLPSYLVVDRTDMRVREEVAQV
jgi:broad specificity phosphatase PhoE